MHMQVVLVRLARHTQDRVDEGHPRRVVAKEGEGGRVELRQLEIVPPERSHLDLVEAHIGELLLQVERLDGVHVVLVPATWHHRRSLGYERR